MYRYGDGTPFPFEENFIDILVAVVEACASAFGAAAQLDGLRQKARDAKRDADEEGRKLSALDHAFGNAAATAGPLLGKDASLTQQTGQRALEAARQAIAAARGQLDKQVQAALAEPRVDVAMKASLAALARFFEHHELPASTWEWKWVHSDGSEATVRSGRFVATFTLESPWTAPVRIGSLVPDLRVHLPSKNVFGKLGLRTRSLDRSGLVSAERHGDRIVLGVREHVAKPSGGWRVAFERSGAAFVLCTPVDATGRAVGDEIELDGDDAVGLARLAEAVVTAMDDALARRRLREVTINGKSVQAMTDPAEPARALLDLLAPTIRTMCAKSPTPGELILKRDIADGRREELYVPRPLIAAKYAMLPPEYRKPFEAAGLGREPMTVTDQVDAVVEELTTTEMPAPMRAVPPPPPRAAA